MGIRIAIVAMILPLSLQSLCPPQPRPLGSQAEAAPCTESSKDRDRDDTTFVIDASVLVHALESVWRWSYKGWCYGQRG